MKSSKSSKSTRKSRATSSSSTSSSDTTVVEMTKEESVRDGIVDIRRKLKKGKTKMPKRLVRKEAIMDLGYPFEEEEHFWILQVALEKEQIDEVMQITETYKNKGRHELLQGLYGYVI